MVSPNGPTLPPVFRFIMTPTTFVGKVHPRAGLLWILAACGSLFASGPASADLSGLTLLGHEEMTESFKVSDVWWYVDPNTNKEYAVVGDVSLQKISLVDVTDPTNPFVAGVALGIPSFDVKVWDHYVYGCDGDFDGNDSRIVDISSCPSRHR